MSSCDAIADRRVFMGWDRPCLVAAADWLCQQAGDGIELDLGGLTVVAPSARSGRLLLGELVDRASRAQRMLCPPMLVTPGELLDVILGPVQGVAGPAASELAWAEALRSMDRDAIKPLVSVLPEIDDEASWSGLAGALTRAHTACCAAMLRFVDVPARAARVPGFAEDDRWAAAALVQARYEAVLADWSLADPALAYLDRLAGDPGARCARIVLVGITDLRPAARRALSWMGERATALVAAPPGDAHRFDDHGCVLTDAWAEATLDLSGATIEFADRPRDQAERALLWLAQLDEPVGTDEVVVAVPDPSVAEAFERASDRIASLSVRAAGVDKVDRTTPWSLLDAVADWIDEPTTRALARLARHPDFEAWACRVSGIGPHRYARWLGALDEFRRDQLATRLDTVAVVRSSVRDGVEALSRSAHRLTAAFGSGRAAPIAEHAAALLGVCVAIYDSEPLSRTHPRQRRTIAALEAVRDALADLAGARTVQPTGGGLIRLVLRTIGDRTLADPPGDDAIELLGWLDAAFDPSPVLVVIGLNEGIVPGGGGIDPLVPDALRAELGLVCDRDRLAREAYLLEASVAPRRAVLLVSGRRSTANDPLNPSRLLFRCGRDELVERALRFVEPGPHATPQTVLASRLVPRRVSAFVPMPIVEAEPPTAMRVTDFGAYLRSPYLYYLTRVLGLAELGDETMELDPLAFGSLLHDALALFASSEAADSTDEAQVRRVAVDALDGLALTRYGSRPRGEVRLQLEMARWRLDDFAQWQAHRASEGWRIIAHEWKPDGDAILDVDSEPMTLSGRIDRIDRHATTGALAILDYKTGDSVDHPAKAHRRRDGVWRDLQLPLYRHLAASLTAGSTPTLGYLAIGRPSVGTALLEADWSPDDLLSADEAARDVVRSIRWGEFEMPGTIHTTEGPLAALFGIGLVGLDAEPADEPGDGQP